jgi:hypothetical protein
VSRSALWYAKLNLLKATTYLFPLRAERTKPSLASLLIKPWATLISIPNFEGTEIVIRSTLHVFFYEEYNKEREDLPLIEIEWVF